MSFIPLPQIPTGITIEEYMWCFDVFMILCKDHAMEHAAAADYAFAMLETYYREARATDGIHFSPADAVLEDAENW